MRVFLGNQSVVITKVFILYLRSGLAGSRCFEFLWELGVEVRPRQASLLACVVFVGTREGLVSPRVLV